MHPFFKDIDWNQVIQKASSGPIVPELKDEEDVSAFDSSFTSMTPAITPSSHDPLSAYFIEVTEEKNREMCESEEDAFEMEDEEQDFFAKMLRRQSNLRQPQPLP